MSLGKYIDLEKHSMPVILALTQALNVSLDTFNVIYFNFMYTDVCLPIVQGSQNAVL